MCKRTKRTWAGTESTFCREPSPGILHIECSTFTASSFRIWNSSTGILSLPGASMRNSARGKGHEEGGSAYAKAGSSLRSPPGNSRASTPQNQSLPTFCFVPWRAPSRSAQTFKKKKHKNLSTTFWFKAIAATSVCAFQGSRVPHFAPKASQSVA